MTIRIIMSSALALVLASGCVGTDVGNPGTSPTELEFVVPEVQTSMQALVAVGWTIKTLDVHIEGLGAVSDNEPNPELNLVSGPSKFDLVGISRRLEFESNVDLVQQLEIRFERDSAPWLEAEFVAADGRVIFIEATNPDRIRYSGEIPLNEGLLFSTHPVLSWLTEETTALEALPNQALISETNEPQLFRSFLKAFAPHAKLFVDRDKDLKFGLQDQNVGTPTP
jgi:hypothetical protein